LARDWKLIGILTGAALDCGPQPGGTSPALWWSVIAVKPIERRGRQMLQCAGHLTKYIEMDVITSFFDIMSEVQKDSERSSVEIGFFLFI
jgi:hypothetical protein